MQHDEQEATEVAITITGAGSAKLVDSIATLIGELAEDRKARRELSKLRQANRELFLGVALPLLQPLAKKLLDDLKLGDDPAPKAPSKEGEA